MDVSQGLSIGEWLETSHLQLWRFGHDRAIGFGEDLQRLCRALASELNSLHKRARFNGCIEDKKSFLNNILVHKSYQVELKRHPSSDTYTTTDTTGILKDLKGFINLIKYIGDNHRPLGIMDLPLEYHQFFELVDEFKDLLNQTNLQRNMYGHLRDAEFWIFNFPAFLEPSEKFEIVEKLQRLNNDEKLLEKLKLSVDPEWVDVIMYDDFDHERINRINGSSISEYDVANGKFANFVNKFLDSIEFRSAVANYFQDFFPYAFGELYIAVYKYLPKYDRYFELITFLTNGYRGPFLV
ncbi:hypothetical protein CCACVL1_15545 [Corchorus capsularis]|uniref:Uncharacterized protein n=1 Tax=Corchorus capsularis TaxID=210143 RepID=A0A1R3I204_COCAP|nr:hypothetical protein CCACVL1_15545 [Corchorus capsularis]